MDLLKLLFPPFKKNSNTMSVRFGRVMQFFIYAGSAAWLAYVLKRLTSDPDLLWRDLGGTALVLSLVAGGLALGRGVRYVLSDE